MATALAARDEMPATSMSTAKIAATTMAGRCRFSPPSR